MIGLNHMDNAATEVTEDFIADWVYCEFEGEVHENTPDPFNKGPVYELEEEEMGEDWWELRKDSQYGDALLWFFTCPGPHKQLQAQKGPPMEGYNPDQMENANHTEKPKRKKDPKLETDRVIQAIKSLEPATLDEITSDIYGSSDKTRRSRVYHHVKKLDDRGTIHRVGSSLPAIYRMNDAKPSNTVSTGDLFELIGMIGEKTAVRSLDTQQIYVLEEV